MNALVLGALGWAWPHTADPCLHPVEPVAEVRLDEPGLLWVALLEVDPSLHHDADPDLALVVRPADDSACVLLVDALGAGVLPAGSYRVEVHARDGSQPSVAVQVAHTPVSTLIDHGMTPALAERALLAVDSAWSAGLAQRPRLVVVDFSLPSDQDRLWLIDLDEARVRRRWLVSHGKRSGGHDERMAVRFSNTPFSNQSSLGLLVGSETYTGSHGRSLRLDGLEPAFNDLARPRAIVVHGAEYARPEHVAEWGYLGRSFGCPAIDDRDAQEVIDALARGGLLFAWHPVGDWDHQSELWWEPPLPGW